MGRMEEEACARVDVPAREALRVARGRVLLKTAGIVAVAAAAAGRNIVGAYGIPPACTGVGPSGESSSIPCFGRLLFLFDKTVIAVVTSAEMS